MVELWFLFSAYCPTKLYICSKFHENIDDRFINRVDTILKLIILKGHYSAKNNNVAGVTVLILYTLSDAALYLYQVS